MQNFTNCIDCDRQVVSFFSFKKENLVRCPFCHLNDKWNHFEKASWKSNSNFDIDLCNKWLSELDSFDIKRQMPLGMGVYSLVLTWLMHEKLNEAYDLLGGLQQPSMSTEELTEENKIVNDEYDRKDKDKIQKTVKQIAISLGVEL